MATVVAIVCVAFAATMEVMNLHPQYAQLSPFSSEEVSTKI
jgi:hypothetical protein